MKNKLFRILFFLISLYVLISVLIKADLIYNSLFVGSSGVCLLALAVAKRAFGSDKVLYFKAYIFAGWFIINASIIPFMPLIGWDVANGIANGSLYGIVVGCILISKEFWSNSKENKD